MSTEYQINISTKTAYKNSGRSYSNEVSRSGSSTVGPRAAEIEATSLCQSGLNGVSSGFPSPPNGGSTNSQDEFGTWMSGEQQNGPNITVAGHYVGEIETDDFQYTSLYAATAKGQKYRDGEVYQLKLDFTLPVGITSDKIDEVYLSFACSTSWNSGGVEMVVLAPKGTSTQTSYIRPTSSSDIVVAKNTFSITGGQTTANFEITEAFKQCLDTQQGWLTLSRNTNTCSNTREVWVSGTPVITYTLTYSNCIAPNSVTFTQSGVIASASTSGIISRATGAANVVVTWSAGGNGENNPLTGYTMYYSSGAPPTKETTTKITTASNVLTANIDISSFTRGTTYYVKVVTNGTVEGYDSDISEAGCSFTINSLPEAPAVSVNQSRIKSTGSTTIIFTVTPGADVNTSQTKTLYYSTSSSGTKTLFTSPLSRPLSAQTTYYFWTFDGLEYSTNYTSKTITKNQAPTIGSVTMTAYNNTTYLPVTRDGYVKNINASVSGIEKDSAATLTYQWYLEIGDDADATTYSPISLDIDGDTSQGLNNIDVTYYGVTFDNAYRVKLVITDDIGETAEKSSTQVFAIPAAPTINYIYNQKNSSYATYSNRFHFEDGLRFVYSGQNTGITRELYYSTSNDGSYTLMNLNEPTSSDGSYFNDVTLTSFTRGGYYYFKIKYILSSSINMYATITAVTDESTPQNCWYDNDQKTTKGFMRALDIIPKNIEITDVVKPYTDSTFTFNFNNQPQWNATQDVSTEYGDIYTINIKGNNNSITLTTTGNNSSGTVTSTMYNFSSSISTADWKTITTGTTRAPNKKYTLTLEIIATNGFGHAFSAIQTFTADFVEKVNSFGANGPELRIQTGTNEYTKIPSSYGQLGNSRYPIFEGQTLQVAVNGVTTYADQAATVHFMLGDISLGQTSIASTEWTAPSGYDHLYTLNVEKTIPYTVPKNSVVDEASNVRNFYIKIVLLEDNNTITLSTDTGQSNGNLNTCIHYRFDLDAVKFSSDNPSEDNNNFYVDWFCTRVGDDNVVDFGGMTPESYYSKSYSSITLQLRYDTTSSGEYSNNNNVGNPVSLSNVGTGNIPTHDTIGGSASISTDIVYFGIYVTYILAFVSIGTKIPTGQTTYTRLYKNLATLYRSTPNLLYGTNFFVLNASSPLETTVNQVPTQVTDQVLELHPGTGGRNKIYFHNTNHYIMIDDNNNEVIFEGMIVNGGTWNT